MHFNALDVAEVHLVAPPLGSLVLRWWQFSFEREGEKKKEWHQRVRGCFFSQRIVVLEMRMNDFQLLKNRVHLRLSVPQGRTRLSHGTRVITAFLFTRLCFLSS